MSDEGAADRYRELVATGKAPLRGTRRVVAKRVCGSLEFDRSYHATSRCGCVARRARACAGFPWTDWHVALRIGSELANLFVAKRNIRGRRPQHLRDRESRIRHGDSWSRSWVSDVRAACRFHRVIDVADGVDS